MDDKLVLACLGKTSSSGGLNLPEIKKIASDMGVSTAGTRAEILKRICHPTPAGVGVGVGAGAHVADDADADEDTIDDLLTRKAGYEQAIRANTSMINMDKETVRYAKKTVATIHATKEMTAELERQLARYTGDIDYYGKKIIEKEKALFENREKLDTILKLIATAKPSRAKVARAPPIMRADGVYVDFRPDFSKVLPYFSREVTRISADGLVFLNDFINKIARKITISATSFNKDPEVKESDLGDIKTNQIRNGLRLVLTNDFLKHSITSGVTAVSKSTERGVVDLVFDQKTILDHFKPLNPSNDSAIFINAVLDYLLESIVEISLKIHEGNGGGGGSLSLDDIQKGINSDPDLTALVASAQEPAEVIFGDFYTMREFLDYWSIVMVRRLRDGKANKNIKSLVDKNLLRDIMNLDKKSIDYDEELKSLGENIRWILEEMSVSDAIKFIRNYCL